MRSILVALLILAVSAASAQQARPPQPTPPAPSAQPDSRLRVLVDLSRPLFAARDANGRLAGFDIDLAQALCARMKADCVVEAIDWDELRAEMAAGKADLAFGGIDIADLPAERSVFAARYGRVPLSIVKRKGVPLEATPAGLTGQRIAVQRSTRWAQWLRALGTVTVVELETPDEVRSALTSKQVDGGLLGPVRTIAWMERERAPDGCCELAKPELRDPAVTGPGVAVLMRSDVKLKERVDKAMEALRNDGTIRRLAVKYLPFPLL